MPLTPKGTPELVSGKWMPFFIEGHLVRMASKLDVGENVTQEAVGEMGSLKQHQFRDPNYGTLAFDLIKSNDFSLDAIITGQSPVNRQIATIFRSPEVVPSLAWSYTMNRSRTNYIYSAYYGEYMPGALGDTNAVGARGTKPYTGNCDIPQSLNGVGPFMINKLLDSTTDPDNFIQKTDILDPLPIEVPRTGIAGLNGNYAINIRLVKMKAVTTLAVNITAVEQIGLKTPDGIYTFDIIYDAGPPKTLTITVTGPNSYIYSEVITGPVAAPIENLTLLPGTKITIAIDTTPWANETGTITLGDTIASAFLDIKSDYVDKDGNIKISKIDASDIGITVPGVGETVMANILYLYDFKTKPGVYPAVKPMEFIVDNAIE